MIQRILARPALALLLNAVLAVGLAAQESPFAQAQLGQQSLRPFWHVYIAYAIVIVLIGAWAVSIARRLRSVEDRLID